MHFHIEFVCRFLLWTNIYLLIYQILRYLLCYFHVGRGKTYKENWKVAKLSHHNIKMFFSINIVAFRFWICFPGYRNYSQKPGLLLQQILFHKILFLMLTKKNSTSCIDLCHWKYDSLDQHSSLQRAYIFLYFCR